MSLPNGFLDELRTRLSLSQVVGRKVTWDARKSNQGKGDMWAPCPFHQEKTASFHVDDHKGYYYCFGCHAKGDAITFVRETENVGFMEAVEILAKDAGMQMPASDPKAKEKADRRTQLAEVMELAVQHFRLQLKTAAGTQARTYLEKNRGLKPDAWDRWDIGFAPEAWQNLWDALKLKGVSDDLILAAGLAKPSQKGGKPYDTFRGRIMFPIRDARGRCIAFGGRAMDPNDTAKYLNSPETELFDKGRNLFNFGPARTACGKGQPLVVAEGYMDVIALAEHGFEAAVAPLGTAITEQQLSMLWQISDEPIIALDGDQAGQRAAMRTIDTALPLLKAAKTLRFASMPAGKDPDDLLKSEGVSALKQRLDAGVPLIQMLWQRETAGKSFDSPERKAALDASLQNAARRIEDPSVRQYYNQEFKSLKWQFFRQRPALPQKPFQRGGRDITPTPLPDTKASLLAQTDAAMEHIRESVILAALIVTPEITEEVDMKLGAMACRDSALAQIRDILLSHASEGPDAVQEKIVANIGADALDKLLNARHVAIVPCIRNPGNTDLTRTTVLEELHKLNAIQGLGDEIEDAVQDMEGMVDEGLTWRLSEAVNAASHAVRSGQEDEIAYDRGDNGALVNRAEKDTFAKLMESISFSKTKK